MFNTQLDYLLCCAQLISGLIHHSEPVRPGSPLKGWDWIVESPRFKSRLQPMFRTKEPKRKKNFTVIVQYANSDVCTLNPKPLETW